MHDSSNSNDLPPDSLEYESMATGISREEFRAYAALIASSTLLQRAVERNLREQADLTQVQFEILMNLANAGDSGIRMAQLADALIVSRSGLSYQVAQLESRGWITRERSADDERGVVAHITPEGERHAAARVRRPHRHRAQRLPRRRRARRARRRSPPSSSASSGGSDSQLPAAIPVRGGTRLETPGGAPCLGLEHVQYMVLPVVMRFAADVAPSSTLRRGTACSQPVTALPVRAVPASTGRRLPVA